MIGADGVQRSAGASADRFDTGLARVVTDWGWWERYRRSVLYGGVARVWRRKHWLKDGLAEQQAE